MSVLFADLVGFTTLAEGRDAEDTRELLSRYFDLAREVVGRYGGTVEKFIGDAVMAVWGAPVAHEDDAERAVRAGLELVDAVTALGPGIAARAGVLTGEAAVTLGADRPGDGRRRPREHREPPPVGRPTGHGPRRGGDRSGPPPARSPSRRPASRPSRARRAPVPAWRALRVVAERGGRNRAETLEAPFVGRDDELRLLKDLFHATARERRARLVSVTGIGGIGKTRLAWELEKYLDGLVEPIWRHEGRSPAYGEGITFWALGEMVRRRAGLVETDDERDDPDEGRGDRRGARPRPDERRWIEPALLALLGIDTGAVDPEQLFAAWRMFFERLAATGTVVMVFEDLQWADPGLLDFIDALLEWSRSFPIFVLTLARPELLERRPDWGAGKRSFTSLFLEPLPPAAMRDAPRRARAGASRGRRQGDRRARRRGAALCGRDGPDAPRRGQARARGRRLPAGRRPLDAGRAGRRSPRSSRARLDGLEPADRSLLCDAAVLGQSFTLAGLAAVSGIPEPELEPRLRSLVRRELLALETDPRSPERGQYAFVQALVREVAYNTLARRDRKARHLAAACFFESLGSDEAAGALAGHYLAAYRNAPEGAEADAVAAQARIALRAAAERATALGAHAQAVALLEQALSMTTDLPEQALLLERAGRSASLAADHEAAERYLVRATEIQRGLGDRSATARTIAELGGALIDGSRYDRALAILEPSAVEFADLAGDPGAVALDGQLARALMLGLQHQRAVEVADRVLAAAERGDFVGIVADTLITKGVALVYIGRAYEGVGAIRAGIELARTQGLMAITWRGLNALGVSLRDSDLRGALETARDCVRTGGATR